MPYAELVKDGRESEVDEVLNFAANAFKDCGAVFMLGDILNSRVNSAGTLARFVSFLESLGDKEVFVLGGNHDTFGDGSSAFDFISRLTNKHNWHLVVSREVGVNIGGVVVNMLPYFHRASLGVSSNEEWQVAVDNRLSSLFGEILLTHHSIEGCGVSDYVSTDSFNEPTLKLSDISKFKLVVGGHIHRPSDNGFVHVLGSTFNQEVGEYGKRIAIIDTETLSFEPIALPGRHIVRINDPDTGFSKAVIAEHGTNAIVKIEVTTERAPEALAALKEEAKVFDGSILLEKYSSKRQVADVAGGLEELSLSNLAKAYANAKGIDPTVMQRGLELLLC